MAISLFELLAQVYRKLAECPGSAAGASALLEAVMRADALLEEHVISPSAKHAEALAKSVLKSSLARLDPLFSRVVGNGASVPAEGTMERTLGPSALSGAL